MTITPVTNCPTFDLYILDCYDGIVDPSVSRGFSEMTLPLRQAREMAREIRRQGWAVVIVPTIYRDAKLLLSEASTIASRAFTDWKALHTKEQFGDLSEGGDEGGWWIFQADNRTAQEAGMIPGLFIIRVDKLLGRPLSDEESRWVDQLQNEPRR